MAVYCYMQLRKAKTLPPSIVDSYQLKPDLKLILFLILLGQVGDSKADIAAEKHDELPEKHGEQKANELAVVPYVNVLNKRDTTDGMVESDDEAFHENGSLNTQSVQINVDSPIHGRDEEKHIGKFHVTHFRR